MDTHEQHKRLTVTVKGDAAKFGVAASKAAEGIVSSAMPDFAARMSSTFESLFKSSAVAKVGKSPWPALESNFAQQFSGLRDVEETIGRLQAASRMQLPEIPEVDVDGILEGIEERERRHRAAAEAQQQTADAISALVDLFRIQVETSQVQRKQLDVLRESWDKSHRVMLWALAVAFLALVATGFGVIVQLVG